MKETTIRGVRYYVHPCGRKFRKLVSNGPNSVATHLCELITADTLRYPGETQVRMKVRAMAFRLGWDGETREFPVPQREGV